MLKSIYWMTARVYNPVLVTFLGYRAHELAADSFVSHWSPGDRPSAESVVLDLGCGTGLTAEALLKRVCVVVDGLDFSEAMLDRARAKGIYRHLFEADATMPLPVAEASYAGAISSGLFTHGHVGVEALEPILKALAPGSIFSFTVYSTVWTRAGFATRLMELERDRRIDVLEDRETGHFRRLSGQRVHVVTIRIR